MGRRFASWFHPQFDAGPTRGQNRRHNAPPAGIRAPSVLVCALTGAARAPYLRVRSGSSSEVVFVRAMAGYARSRWRTLPEGWSRSTRPHQRLVCGCRCAAAMIARATAGCQVGHWAERHLHAAGDTRRTMLPATAHKFAARATPVPSRASSFFGLQNARQSRSSRRAELTCKILEPCYNTQVFDGRT